MSEEFEEKPKTIKATELLQELDSKVSEILAYVKNIDFKYNLILDKLNKPISFVEVEKKEKVALIDPLDSVSFVEHKSKSLFEEPKDLKSKIAAALSAASAATDSNKSENINTKSNKKISVQQRIVYPDNKNVFMASVEILDLNGNIIEKLKTNNVGKWIVTLTSGEYQVKINKTSTNNKPEINMIYNITVPDQNTILDLGNKIVT